MLSWCVVHVHVFMDWSNWNISMLTDPIHHSNETWHDWTRSIPLCGRENYLLVVLRSINYSKSRFIYNTLEVLEALTYNLHSSISNQELRLWCKSITQHRQSIVITTYCSSEGEGITVFLRLPKSSTEQRSTGTLEMSNWMSETTLIITHSPDGRSKAPRVYHRAREGYCSARTHRRWRCEVTVCGCRTCADRQRKEEQWCLTYTGKGMSCSSEICKLSIA